MIFSKAQEIQGNYNTRPDQPSRSLFTKVLIVDKRNPQLSPQVFSMSPETLIEMDDLQALKSHFISGFHDESFIPIGVMVSIDRKKKMVKLTDGQLVSYEHLVIATNPKRNSSEDVNEFFSGLATLVDALRINKQKIAFSNFDYDLTTSETLDKKAIHLTDEKDQISQSIYEGEKPSSDWFFDIGVRLYEVQV